MMTKMWANLVEGPEAVETVVFSGGACNIITEEGKLDRNPGRDELNSWLDSKAFAFFDPQIHPATHGREYDYDIDGPAEQNARRYAEITLYEFVSTSLGGVSCLEVLRDAAEGKLIVVWFNGADDDFDKKGNQLFKPAGDPTSGDPVVVAHLKEYKKNGDNLRKNLPAFLKGKANVAIVRSLDEVKDAISKMLYS